MTTSAPLATDPGPKPAGALRVAHTGDLHLTSGPRFADTVRVLDYIEQDGRAAGVDLWLIGGDLTGVHDVPHVATIEEREYLADLFQRMAETAPVLVLYGNHDVATDIALYRRMKGPHPIEVAVRPGTYRLAGANIRCLPFPFIAGMTNLPVGDDRSIRAENEAASQVVLGLLLEWSDLKEAGRSFASIPEILFAHLTVRGARTSGDEILAGQEVELTTEDVDGFGADYAALSHIHLHQQVGAKACYAGSPSAQTFGEPDEKGYLIADVFVDENPQVYRRVTPARRMVTVDATWAQVGGQWQWLGNAEDEIAGLPDGAEVKIRVKLPEDAVSSCPVDELAAKYSAAGFLVAKPERQIVPKVRVRSEEISAAVSNRDKLLAYWASLKHPPKPAQQERCLELLVSLENEVAGNVRSETGGEEQAA